MVLLSRLPHFRLALRVLFACSMLCGPSARACAQADFAGGRELLALANQDRARRQLAPLRWDPALAQAALQHARAIATQSSLEHQYPREPELLRRASLSGAHLAAVAENLFRGVAPTLDTVEQTWLTTAIHRANLLNPQFDVAGVALVQLPDGRLLAVEDLGQAAAPTDPPAAEASLLRSLRQLGVGDVRVSSAAEMLCREYSDSPSASPPATIVQWDGPAPTTLPAALLDLLHRQTVREAEVGTCPGKASSQGFSTTRVTLLLR